MCTSKGEGLESRDPYSNSNNEENPPKLQRATSRGGGVSFRNFSRVFFPLPRKLFFVGHSSSGEGNLHETNRSLRTSINRIRTGGSDSKAHLMVSPKEMGKQFKFSLFRGIDTRGIVD